MELTPAHINEIRKYLLATPEEEIGLPMKPNSPLGNFLNQLKQIFIQRESAANLHSFLVSNSADVYLPQLKDLQQQYYSKLAFEYNSGRSNPEINALLSANNTDFLNEMLFQQELATSFILKNRAALKKKFQQLQLQPNITEEEIALALKIANRKKLKNKFQAIKELEIANMNGPIPSGAISRTKYRMILFIIAVLCIVALIVLNRLNKNPAVDASIKKENTTDPILKTDTVQQQMNQLNDSMQGQKTTARKGAGKSSPHATSSNDAMQKQVQDAADTNKAAHTSILETDRHTLVIANQTFRDYLQQVKEATMVEHDFEKYLCFRGNTRVVVNGTEKENKNFSWLCNAIRKKDVVVESAELVRKDNCVILIKVQLKSSPILPKKLL